MGHQTIMEMSMDARYCVYVAFLVFICLSSVHARRGDVPIDEKCSQPADIAFLLDDSRTIWGPDFTRMMSFCKQLVREFTVDTQSVRVAAVTFSRGVQEQWGFGDHNTQAKVSNAFDSIRQSSGDRTETWLGLDYVRQTTFKNSLQGVPKILIIISDGVSHDRVATFNAAQAVQAAGIEIIVIGVGDDRMDKQQLQEIASPPTDEHFFTVTQFPDLSTIEALVAQKACASSEFPKDQAIKECHQKPAEVAIILDRSSSVWIEDFKKALTFVCDLIGMFDVGDTRVAAVSYSTNVTIEYYLNEYSNRQDLCDRTHKISHSYVGGVTETAEALKAVRERVFIPSQGDRQGVSHVVIVITDGRSQKWTDTQTEAAALKAMGVHVFAIGIGDQVYPPELQDIASSPPSNYVFQEDSYSALPYIRNVLAYRTCGGQGGPAMPTKTAPTVVG